jgi:hypothetical protein
MAFGETKRPALDTPLLSVFAQTEHMIRSIPVDGSQASSSWHAVSRNYEDPAVHSSDQFNQVIEQVICQRMA